MPKKASSASSKTTYQEDDKRLILRIIYNRVETEPPVGERYEWLLRKIIRESISEYGFKLSAEDTQTVEDDLFSYVASYGPAEVFFTDPQVSEVMINGPQQVYIEKEGQVMPTDVQYDNNEHVRFAINHIINPMGRYISAKNPMIDSRLPDGSRVNAVIPPASPYCPCITIRRFLKDKLTIEQLIDMGSLTPSLAEFLSICVKSRLNIVVAGNTSSGKTTLLNILAGYIPEKERIITVEDSAELSLHQIHKISLEAQPPDYRGEGQVTIRDLVRNTLRMRPDRIIVGEVRGGETLDMLQAMNTGHDGSLTTIHSNSPRDTLSRLETMTLMSGVDIPIQAVRRQISSAINLIVYSNRFADGSRKVTQVSEVVGMEGDIITMTDLFQFQPSGFDENRRIKGVFRSTGLRPQFSRMIETAGFHLDAKMFMNQTI